MVTVQIPDLNPLLSCALAVSTIVDYRYLQFNPITNNLEYPLTGDHYARLLASQSPSN